MVLVTVVRRRGKLEHRAAAARRSSKRPICTVHPRVEEFERVPEVAMEPRRSMSPANDERDGDTLWPCMDPAKKPEIMDNLHVFRNKKDFNKQTGKPWKRGYLL
ncbi:hypothetical protein PR202_ga28050 [Eleusine coracana subsp. coracana]|uniref:Uncharacterized protein n=1 Tax=Eleusine coracana subsp. coracana TaxID=191504 RepID=A0AAV5DHL2_ELECO|nr:hypothetical protein PR202_ga28050 [Eleusine coracana subsp. coracana]